MKVQYPLRARHSFSLLHILLDWPDISPVWAGARCAAGLDTLGPEVAREPGEAAVTPPGVRAQVAEKKNK